MQRQVSSLLYERLIVSKDKDKIIELSREGHKIREGKDLVNGEFMSCNLKKYNVSSNFLQEIDLVLNGIYGSSNQVKARDYTPKILVDNGVKDLPMLMTAKHIKSTILTKEEAIIRNIYIKNVNYHGLGKNLLIKAIESMDYPLEIYKKSNNNYIIITEIKNNMGDNIIVPIKVNGKGVYNNIYIKENQITSVYGKRNLQNYIKNNNFKIIYKKGITLNERVQYSNISNSTDENIPQV